MQEEIDKLKGFLLQKEETKDSGNSTYVWEKTSEFLKAVIKDFRANYGTLLNFRNGDFRDARKELLKSFSDPDKPPIGSKNDPWIRTLLEGDLKLEAFSQFLSTNYRPPNDPVSIFCDLYFLLIYYKHLAVEMPLPLTLRIDYVLALLIAESTSTFYEIDRQGGHKARTSKSARTKGAEKQRQKALVLKEFKKIDKTNLTKNKVAQLIRENLRGIVQHPPSETTIKRYLEEEGKV